jgi:hypothetical protein
MAALLDTRNVYPSSGSALTYSKLMDPDPDKAQH